MQGPPPPWLYSRIYQSIPFSRAEYQSNPSYRHQTTMSMLFGQPPYVGLLSPENRPILPQYGYTVPYQQMPVNLERGYVFPF